MRRKWVKWAVLVSGLVILAWLVVWRGHLGAPRIHMRREPHELECRVYGVSEALVAVMEQKRKANDLHVDAEPIVSALAQVAEIHSWSVMVPDGPNSATSEFRFDKVFRYLPATKVILALATPDEHSNAVVRLKAQGVWHEVPAGNEYESP